MPDKHFSWKDAIPSIIAGIFFIAQIFYGFFYANTTRNIIIAYLGIGCFLVSGVFGMAPVFVFPKKGGVEKGKSFIHTTKIVDTGIYAIVRHPQYSAFFLWTIGAMCLFQDSIVILLGVPVIFLTYIDMVREDRVNKIKFGKSYEEYMKKVPRANFILGIIRIARRKQP
jgi:protein-S-isoprenylcysteine O-methyltransferase Ste14